MKKRNLLSLRDGGEPLLGSVGPYWSDSNAQFEAQKPSTFSRVVRAVNPITSLGSALGQVHDAASEGDVGGAAMAATGAIPMGLMAARAIPAAQAAAPTLRSAVPVLKNSQLRTMATGGTVLAGTPAVVPATTARKRPK